MWWLFIYIIILFFAIFGFYYFVLEDPIESLIDNDN